MTTSAFPMQTEQILSYSTENQFKMNVATEEKSDSILFDEYLTSLRPVKFESSCILVMGRRGTGKSLFMTYIARLMQYEMKRHGIKTRIAANYQLNFADILDPYLSESLTENPLLATDLYICLDEIQTIVNNRRSISRTNLDLSMFLTQIRKRKNQIICTTQFPSQLDRNLLYQLDLFAKCTNLYKVYGKCDDIKTGCGRTNAMHLDVDFWDFFGQYTGKDYRKWFPPRREERDFQKTVHGVDQVFKNYDPDQFIMPTWSKDELRDQVADEYYGEIKTLPHNAKTDETGILIDEFENDPLGRILGKTTNYDNPEQVLEDFSHITTPFSYDTISYELKRSDSKIKSKNHVKKYLKSKNWEVFDDENGNTLIRSPYME